MIRSLAHALLAIAAFVGACSSTPTTVSPLAQARELYEDGDMDDAFERAVDASSSSDLLTAQRAQLVAGLAAVELDRPDAESWLLRASSGPDAEASGTALASVATLQERRGKLDAAATSMHRASMLLSGSEQARAKSEAQRMAAAVRTANAARAQAAPERTASSGAGVPSAARAPGAVAKGNASSRKGAASKGSASKADPTDKAQAPLATPKGQRWTLQAGAFESAKKAEVLAAELEKETSAKGLPMPEVVTVTVRGKTMFRVQVGQYDSRALAKAALDAWGRKGLLLGTTD